MQAISKEKSNIEAKKLENASKSKGIDSKGIR